MTTSHENDNSGSLWRQNRLSSREGTFFFLLEERGRGAEGWARASEDSVFTNWVGPRTSFVRSRGRVTLSQIVCLHNQTPFNASRIDCLVDRKAAGIFCRLQVEI